MYEFKYPKIAEMPAEKLEGAIEFLALSVEDKLNNSEKGLNILEILNLQSAISHIRSGFNVCINMDNIGDEPFDYSVIDKLIENGRQIKKPLRLYVTGSSKFGNESESVKMAFSQTAIDNLIELNNYLVDRDEDGLFFMEDATSPESSWTFEEVITANSQIESIVEYINEKKLTPFEAAAFIHQYITTQFTYKDDEYNPIMSRSLVGVLNSDEIVCVGYATLTKAVIDRLNMPGLECSTFTSKIIPNRDGPEIEGIDLNAPYTGHMQNLIKIDDPSYNIKGNYISDACWDSNNKNFPNGKGIANFMYPVEDLIHYKGLNFDQFHSKVDNLFKMVGLANRRLDPYSLPIISENIDKSTPIEAEKYEECLTNLFVKMNPEDSKEKIAEKVASVMKLTNLTAFLIFDEKAIGSIAKYANSTIKSYVSEETEEFDEDLVLEETDENARGME